jgi:hypothetical protein
MFLGDVPVRDERLVELVLVARSTDEQPNVLPDATQSAVTSLPSSSRTYGVNGSSPPSSWASDRKRRIHSASRAESLVTAISRYDDLRMDST